MPLPEVSRSPPSNPVWCLLHVKVNPHQRILILLPHGTMAQGYSPRIVEVAANIKSDPAGKVDGSSNVEGTKPLAPPPRPAQTQAANTPDYFNSQLGGSLSLEPNPFEQSFGGGTSAETPGGTKLPPVASLTSPSSLLPGSGATPFNWGGGSLRTGPLSPAMLSAPANDYFGDAHHLRGGFPTPNESSLRTGLTPGGSGSMFPAPSPNSQALYASLAGGSATPSTIDFHRTALSAAAKREQGAQLAQGVTSQPQEIANGVVNGKTDGKAASGQFDPHDNDAANGLFLLAQGRNGTPAANQFAATTQASSHAHPAPVVPQAINTSPQMGSINGNGSVGSGRGVSEAGSAMSEESEIARPNTRGKGKRNSTAAATTGRRKAEEPPAKAPASKKAKVNNAPPITNGDMDDYSDDEGDMKHDENGTKIKMTDEEKRKNFLERNRYVLVSGLFAHSTN
jgi:ATF/CREB family transcription factor